MGRLSWRRLRERDSHCRASPGSQYERADNKSLNKIAALTRQNRKRNIDSECYVPSDAGHLWSCSVGPSPDGFSPNVLCRADPVWGEKLSLFGHLRYLFCIQENNSIPK